MTRLIFLGPPGAGKGTQAKILADLRNIPHISTGDILRNAVAFHSSLGEKVQSYMDEGELVPDELLFDLIRHRLSQTDAVERGWILDGFPRNVSQASFLENLLQELNQSCDRVIYLEVPDEVLTERLHERGRKDDSQATIRKRLEVYRTQTVPLVDFYRERSLLKTINGDLPMQEVTKSLRQLVGS